MISARDLPLLIGGMMLVGCADAGGSASSTVTRDRSGVPIVHSPSPSLGPDAWTLSELPVFSVGDADGADEYWFGEVMGMTRLADGTVVVADMQRSRLAFYRPDGRFLRATGRRGEGPGEFRQIMALHRLPGDSILVEDFNGFAQLFDPSGAIARRISLASGSGAIPQLQRFRLIGTFGDGTFAASSGGFRTGNGALPDSAWIYRLAADGAVEDSIFSYATRIKLGAEGQPVQEIFSARHLPAVAQGRFYSGDPSAYRVEIRDRDGRLRHVVTRGWTPALVTEAEVDAYRESHIGMVGEGGREVPPRLQAQRARNFDSSPVASHHPAFLRMLVDGGRNLWLQERALEHQLPAGGFQPTTDAPMRWSVFDAAGAWLTDVTTPPNFRVFEIGEDYVLGLGRNESGVEQVRLYALQKP